MGQDSPRSITILTAIATTFGVTSCMGL
ncbi:MAG: smalltalk protein [Bacteroides sp.]|nr:smalltalk protein [Bacteroides sp.]